LQQTAIWYSETAGPFFGYRRVRLKFFLACSCNCEVCISRCCGRFFGRFVDRCADRLLSNLGPCCDGQQNRAAHAQSGRLGSVRKPSPTIRRRPSIAEKNSRRRPVLGSRDGRRAVPPHTSYPSSPVQTASPPPRGRPRTTPPPEIRARNTLQSRDARPRTTPTRKRETT